MKQEVLKYLAKGFSLILFSLILGLFSEVNASHMAGGSIKYESIGANQYIITATVFKKCGPGTAGFSNTTQAVGGRCMPGGAATAYILPIVSYIAPTPAQYGGPYAGVAITGFGGNPGYLVQEISDVCDKILDPSRSPSSNCRGGAAQGYIKYVFQDVVTISPCNYWRFWFRPPCCRNSDRKSVV